MSACTLARGNTNGGLPTNNSYTNRPTAIDTKHANKIINTIFNSSLIDIEIKECDISNFTENNYRNKDIITAFEMRNVILTDKPKHKQCSCGEYGFFSKVDSGCFSSDLNTCPICNSYDYVCQGDVDFHMHRVNPTLKNADPKWIEWFGEMADGGDEEYEDEEDTFYLSYGKYSRNLFCPNCKILFRSGCVHGIGSKCVSASTNAHLIGEWKLQDGDETFVGMPVFDSIQEWYDLIPRIVILKWICPNKASRCTNNHYSYETHLDYYDECELPDTLDNNDSNTLHLESDSLRSH